MLNDVTPGRIMTVAFMREWKREWDYTRKALKLMARANGQDLNKILITEIEGKKGDREDSEEV